MFIAQFRSAKGGQSSNRWQGLFSLFFSFRLLLIYLTLKKNLSQQVDLVVLFSS